MVGVYRIYIIYTSYILIAVFDCRDNRIYMVGVYIIYSHHVNSVILNIMKRKFIIARQKENYSSEYNKKPKIFREICIKDWHINCIYCNLYNVAIYTSIFNAYF